MAMSAGDMTTIEAWAQGRVNAARLLAPPAFERDDGALMRAGTGLLNAVQGLLHVAEPALVIGEVNDREALNGAELWPPGDDEIGSLHPRRRSRSEVESPARQ
jgi:hypothetical protein